MMSLDDKDLSLLQLSQRYGTSIVSQLVDIGCKSNQVDHAKLRFYISNLQCLQPSGTRLRRRSINAFDRGDYVALSYTWKLSPFEDQTTGQYSVRNWDDNNFQPSSVRKCVLDRALSYMRHNGVNLLWIDAHCIRQDTCTDSDCKRHSRCIEKRNAIHAMDIVYQRSEYPLGLLARPLTTEAELRLLAEILSGGLFTGDHEPRLAAATTIHQAVKALSFLWEVTQDLWWWSAWTFQENYRGGKSMRLLMRHDPSLEPRKRMYRIFGDLPGELCLKSVTFSEQATRLCLALRGVAGLSEEDVERIKTVLQAAGRYTIMLSDSSSMTPTVLADIEARRMEKPWDRLAIVANCCQYPVRLDYGPLSRQGRSISLSVLAMCLLNGEILDNSDDNGDDDNAAAGLKMSKSLDRLMFQKFNAPEHETRRLTYNKGCRLTGAELTMRGVETWGHIWKLGRIIDSGGFPETLPWIDEPRGRLSLDDRRRLLQLVLQLNSFGYRPLASRIEDYLATDARAADKEYTSFTDMYLHHMATELATAVQKGQKLRLGVIWGKEGPSPYRAVFVWSDQGNGGESSPLPPAFVFTSVREGDPGTQLHDANDTDCHVSLEVEIDDSPGGSSVPRLRVQNWRLGMCFFDGCPLIRVRFPWPRALWAVRQ